MYNYIKRPLVKFNRAAVFYAILLIFSLIFTQALRARASSLLFWFVLLLPLVSVLYVLIGKALIRIYVDSDVSKVEKMQELAYEMRIINSAPFAYPFVEAIISIPEDDGVRCTEKPLKLSLSPLSGHVIKQSAFFKYRGTYEIGVRCLYISDFLGLFSIRLDVDIYENVLVFPRKLGMNMKMATSATDIPNDSAKQVFSTEKAEIGNIREYIPGDSQKSIHWKLSSKSSNGTLMVKEFNTNTSQSVYMLCDFSRAIPPEVFENADEIAAREKAEREEANKPKEKTVKLKKSKQSAEGAKAERAAKLAESRAKRGISSKRVGDAAFVDELIDTAYEASNPKQTESDMSDKPAKKGKKLKKTVKTESENVAVTEEMKLKNSLAIGGEVKRDYVSDMNEFCADGVVEMSIGAVLNELRNGNNVTLIWADARQEGGAAAVLLTCPEDFDAVYPVFATTPPCSDKENVTTLLPLITESLNVTIRIATSNLDPLSVSRYSAIPGLFGGAGTGCVAEVLLFNPEERYESVRIRREYVEMCRIKLAQDGVDLTELSASKDENGGISLRKTAH